MTTEPTVPEHAPPGSSGPVCSECGNIPDTTRATCLTCLSGRATDYPPDYDRDRYADHTHECRDCGDEIPAGAACNGNDNCDWPGGTAGCPRADHPGSL